MVGQGSAHGDTQMPVVGQTLAILSPMRTQTVQKTIGIGGKQSKAHFSDHGLCWDMEQKRTQTPLWHPGKRTAAKGVSEGGTPPPQPPKPPSLGAVMLSVQFQPAAPRSLLFALFVSTFLSCYVLGCLKNGNESREKASRADLHLQVRTSRARSA